MPHIVTIEEYRLSSGDTVQVTRLGRTYNFNRLHADDSAPDCHIAILKAEAMELLAQALRADVLEIGE